MEIQINDCPVDFKLDGEKTISEVIDSIAEWTQQRDLIFTEAEINNENYSIDHLPVISLGDVKVLNCFVQSKADVIIASINEGIDYCSRVHKYIDKSISEQDMDISEMENIISGIDWLIEVLQKIAQLLFIDFREVRYKDTTVKDYIDKAGTFKELYKLNSDKKRLFEFIKKEKEIFPILIGIFKMLLMSEDMKILVIQSIDSPDVLIKSLLKIKDEIPEQIKNLEEISISYQTGKDDIASEKLNHFIDFIFQYNRTCYQVVSVFSIDLEEIIVKDISLNEKNNEIQNYLKEMLDVMENSDIISLTDILEYEIKPSFDNLGIYIDSLIDFLEKSN